ncbi:MAG: LPXTG cell wall anchor domain-containing protein, partial [Chloroflexi bacterium]|nr:LPXTG cell wall anchor domain-containing protein [Chloroflexota bacterium]
ITPISLARAAPLGTKVYLRAQVSAPPNLMGARSMYVQDESGGLRVYVQHGDFPDLSLGDWALLTGDMIEQRGEQVIRIFAAYDAILLSSGAPPPPWSIATTKVGEENEGRLVIVEGLIESKSGAYIYVNDGSGLARIYVREATNIDTEPWVKGDDIQIVGIVSQWDSQPPYDVGYRLMPRFPQDLQPLSPPTLVISIPTPVSSPLPQTLPQTGEGWPVLTALGLGALALELGLGLKIWARGRRF